MAKKSIFKRIKDWIVGKDSKIKEANRVTNYGGGASSKSVQKEVKRSIVKAEAKKSGERQTEYQQSAVSKTNSSAFKATPPSVRKAEAKDRQTSKKSDAFNAKNAFKASAQPKFTHQSTALGTMSKRDIDTRTAKINAYNENYKYQSRAADKLKPLIDEKYSGDTAESRRRIKSGEYQSDPNVMKYETLKHPLAMSAGRGALSGTTFGLSELGIALLPKSKEVEEAERLYQANKSKGAEFAGEMAGSLLGFGLTSGASKAAVTKLAPKTTARLGESATEYLAKNGLVRRAAEKEALRKLGTTATKEEIEHFARSKAAKLVAALGEDAAVNLTTSAVADVAQAVVDSDNPAEFLKNLGINVGMDWALGGVTGAVPAFRGSNVDDAFVRNRLAAREGLDDLAKRNRIGMGRPSELTLPKLNAVSDASDAVARYPAIEDAYLDYDGTIEAVNRYYNPDDTAEAAVDRYHDLDIQRAKPKAEPPKVEEPIAEPKVEQTAEAKAEPPKTKSKAKKTPPTGEAKPAAANEQLNFESETNKTVQKSEEPTLQEKAYKAEKKVNEAINNEQVEKERLNRETKKAYHDFDAEIREATGGAKGVRKGVISVSRGANKEEHKRILNTMRREADDLLNGLNPENEGVAETIYNTWDGARKESNMRKSYAKASENLNGIYENLEAKLNKFKADPDSGTELRITDVLDGIAFKQVYKDSGLEVPKEFNEIFDKLILANKTEHAQGLSVVDQILREFDPDWRKAYIKKDFDKYLSRFGNVDSWDEVADALDRRHNADGYLNKKLQELVDFKIGETGTLEEYKKMYANLQAEILRNSKPTIWNIIDANRHGKMLANLATGKRNIYGNLAQRGMYDVADLINAGFEKITQLRIENNPEFAKKFGDGFERTTTPLIKSTDNRAFASLGRLRSGKVGETLSKHIDDVGKAADKKYIQTLESATKEDINDVMGYEKLAPHLEKGMDYKPKNKKEAMLQLAYKGSQVRAKLVSLMLNEPDNWFVERNYRSALAKYLEANGITDMASLNANEAVFKRARNHAKDVALENTYKKATRVTTLIEQARAAGKKKGSNPLLKLVSIGLDTDLPYVKVPVNMFVNNLKYSPMGATVNAFKAVKAISKGDVRGLQKASAELSKGITGTGLMAIGFLMHCDENEQMEDDSWGVIANAANYLKKYGVRDNSVKVGNYNFKISDIGLGATQLLMGAAYADAVNEMGGAPPSLLNAPNAVLKAFNASFDVIGDLGITSNAMDALDAWSPTGNYKDNEKPKLSDRAGNYAMHIAPSYANQFISNPMRAVAKGFTEADLDTGIKKGKDVTPLEKTVRRNLNNVVQGIPYVNEKGVKQLGIEGLPHRVDNHGNLISYGLFPEGRDTTKKKALQALDNYADAFSTRKIVVPEVDKIELSVKKDNGDPFEPQGFDPTREYKIEVGKGKNKVKIDLTGKEREQVARSAKNSGYDMALNLTKNGMFGDRLGKRALEVLNKIPQDEEAARKYIFATKEWKNANNEQRLSWLKDMYGEGQGNTNRGVKRTRNAEAYINIKGHSEGAFRFQNDLEQTYQNQYKENKLKEAGISKGKWADIIQSIYDSNHKWNEEKGKNEDSPNSAKKVRLGILAVEGLTAEQRVAAYNSIRGKRTQFGWTDWDGESVGGGYYRRGYRRWHNWGSYQRKGRKPSNEMPSGFKAKKANISGSSKVSAPNVSGGINTKGTASRMSTSPKINITPLDIKTVRASSSKSRRGSSNLAAALEDIQKTEKKVTPPKARRSK